MSGSLEDIATRAGVSIATASSNMMTNLTVYYGASDLVVCGATFSVKEILNTCTRYKRE